MSRDVLREPELELTRFHGTVTASDRMRELFEVVRRVSRSDANVLVRGETGTGKELIAQAVHTESHRADKPLRALNCATLTPELLASELFGHVRGAFTGAVSDREGIFKLADGGTVFLDEIAELPLDLQARLLRVVQERSFVPVGATEPVQVDFRLISATNKALREEVSRGRFREDLMYRVRVVPVFLPRLAEREGDVEALTWVFIRQHNQRGLRAVSGIEARTMDALLEYPWPGNVRELQNVVEYAFAVGEGDVLTLDQLPPELRGEGPESKTRPKTERELDRDRIVKALEEAKGRKGRAAELLGMSRSTLWRKIRELQIAD